MNNVEPTAMSASAEERAFVESTALFLEPLVPRMAGRILGWLLICDPTEQSAADLANVLHASKGAVSMATRQLVGARLVTRVGVPGTRRTYYRVRADTWVRTALTSLTEFRQLMAQGLALLSGSTAARRERLETLHSLYAYLEREIELLIDRWQRERTGGAP